MRIAFSCRPSAVPYLLVHIANTVVPHSHREERQAARPLFPTCLSMQLNTGSRTHLRLQVSEEELQAIARMGGEGAEGAMMGAGGAATAALAGRYGQTPRDFATPMRTPALTGAGGQDRILAEAGNLARLQVRILCCSTCWSYIVLSFAALH